MSVLTLNCGSSSVKYSVFDTQNQAFSCRGVVERVGGPDCPDHTAAVERVLKTLSKENIRAVGHRVVHGG